MHAALQRMRFLNSCFALEPISAIYAANAIHLNGVSFQKTVIIAATVMKTTNHG
jgi:hypothetical protein